MVYAVGEKIWQYKCVHYKAYFNVLFGSKYIINENGSFLVAAKYVVGLM